MKTLELDRVDTKNTLSEISVHCPVCGAAMEHVDKLEEGRYIFTWFECVKKGCDGQWLQKKSRFDRKVMLRR